MLKKLQMKRNQRTHFGYSPISGGCQLNHGSATSGSSSKYFLFLGLISTQDRKNIRRNDIYASASLLIVWTPVNAFLLLGPMVLILRTCYECDRSSQNTFSYVMKNGRDWSWAHTSTSHIPQDLQASFCKAPSILSVMSDWLHERGNLWLLDSVWSVRLRLKRESNDVKEVVVLLHSKQTSHKREKNLGDSSAKLSIAHGNSKFEDMLHLARASARNCNRWYADRY